MVSNAQRRASAKYDKENAVVLTVKLNKKTDSDILAALESVTNRNAFIKKIIREKIAESERTATND
jgi:hypothetical protein